MRGFKIPLLITLVVSLGFGAGLGIKLKRDRAAQLGVVTGSRKLKVLALKGSLPSEISRHFATSENIQLDLVTEETPDTVFQRLQAGGDFDVVTLLTTQISKANQALKLQPIQTSSLTGFVFASRDFVDVPGRGADVVPFLWGVLNLAKRNPADRPLNIRTLTFGELSVVSEHAFNVGHSQGPGLVWVLNLAMTASAQNQDEARTFFNFMLKPEVALELSKLTHQSSTNLGVNKSSLDENLKPHVLRQIPLNRLQLVFDEAVPETPVIRLAQKTTETLTPTLTPKPGVRPAKKIVEKPTPQPEADPNDAIDSSEGD